MLPLKIKIDQDFNLRHHVFAAQHFIEWLAIWRVVHGVNLWPEVPMRSLGSSLLMINILQTQLTESSILGVNNNQL